MLMRAAIISLNALVATSAAAQLQSFPEGFRSHDIETNGVVLHVRVGGSGRRSS
ncbi:hypothetical protein [Aurantimonas sp. VKM B-3413]|uniref:hypothetical protein n=1 Tax=Aurantimonas sp. VKM B-3413 TaxID=2779401 RepID=UPI001E3F114E|nr:hypothetical protein [Aurantimonas sp. VKM B-3413]MCB8838690.1 hypothetical protein [Aurantimonas sp. VKM B-3413]